jgi:hypothetical protein
MTTVHAESSSRQRDLPELPPRRQVIGAAVLVVGLTLGLFGLVWDIEWHSDVGPDTFFTAPHLMLYASSAVSGLGCLAVVLLHTVAVRRDLADDSTPAVTVLGTFRAPLPFLVAGLGIAGGLLYGLGDLWWHSVYGFDVTPTSPPHVAMSICDLAASTGSIMAASSLRATRFGRWAFALACSCALGTWTFLLYSVPDVAGIPGLVLAMPVLCALLLALFAGTTRSPKWVLAFGLTFAVLQGVTALWTPAITNWYADSLGLAIRDFASPLPSMPLTYPFALLPAAAVVAGGMWLARRRNVHPRWAFAAIGAVASLVVLAGYLVLGLPVPLYGYLAVAVLGAAAAILGWHLATPLRQLAPRKVTA